MRPFKRVPRRPRTLSSKKTPRLSRRLWCIGGLILLAGTGDVLFRLGDALRSGSVGIMLRLGYDIECLFAGAAILVGGGLLLDYMERKQEKER